MKNESVPIYTLAAVQGVALFAGIMPDIHDIRDGTQEQMGHKVHTSMLIASTLTMGLALLITSLTKNSKPLIIATVTIVGTAAVYETLLRSTP